MTDYHFFPVSKMMVVIKNALGFKTDTDSFNSIYF